MSLWQLLCMLFLCGQPYTPYTLALFPQITLIIMLLSVAIGKGNAYLTFSVHFLSFRLYEKISLRLENVTTDMLILPVPQNDGLPEDWKWFATHWYRGICIPHGGIFGKSQFSSLSHCAKFFLTHEFWKKILLVYSFAIWQNCYRCKISIKLFFPRKSYWNGERFTLQILLVVTNKFIKTIVLVLGIF